MPQFVFLSHENKERYLRVIAPLRNLLARLGFHPNVLSLGGLILSMLAGLIYSTGSFFWGGCVVVLAGTSDVLDGEIARQTGKASQFGAFLDSTLDRIGEAFVFLGLAWHFSGGPALLELGSRDMASFQSPWTVFFIVLAMAGSFVVSYTRARADGLGVECEVGLMQRPERITLLIIGSLLGSIPVIGYPLIKLTLFLLAVLSNATAIQRMVYVRNQLLKENRSK